MLYRLFCFFLIATVLLPPANAAVSELFVTPENPVVGDTITISGTASPDESVKVVVSFEKTVSPSDGMYLYRMDGIEVPSGSNSFTVTAKVVNNLYVTLFGLSKGVDATEGIATIYHYNLASGLYDVEIYGHPAAGTSVVTIEILAAQYIYADGNGKFVYSYATSSIPVGDFQLNVSGLAKTITLSASRSDESSSGGVSSGGGTSGETFENILISETQREYVIKDSNVSYNFHLDGNVVRYINFTGLTNSGTITSKVEILDHTSTLVDSTPPNIVYKNLNIWVGNLGWANPENIASPSINFFVEKSWITENNIDNSTIRLNRYNDGEWNPLDTEKMGEDEDNLYFEAQTPEFSSFAITGKVKQSEVVQPIATTYLESGLMPQTTEPHETKPTQSASKTTGFKISTGVLGLLVALFIMRKKC